MTSTLVALLAFAGVALAVVGVALWRSRRQLAGAQRRISQLERDLDSALRPPPARGPAQRAVRRVVRTATTVRDRGLAGLLQSSIDDLLAWVAEERADIVGMAAADGTVTLLFSDIEDSTSLNDRLGDATWVRVLAAHDDLVRARVEKYRGQVVKSAGDGFMVAFRDPEAACRAALEVQRDLRRTLDPLLRLVAPVRVRIGIHTGTVVSRDGDYFGRNVAMAARVGSLASGGEVLVSDAVREALDDDALIELEQVAEVELKGLPGLHLLWRATWRGRPPRGRAIASEA